MLVRYRVDRDNVITDVAGHWDEFARNNQGQALLGGAVTGRPLSDFIKGDNVRRQTLAMIHSARVRNQIVRLSYRCDSAGEKRSMQMVIRPEPGGSAWLEHEVVSISPRSEPVSTRYTNLPGIPSWQLCNVCGRVRDGVEWLEADTARAEGRIPPDDPLNVIFTICAGCSEEILQRMSGGRRA